METQQHFAKHMLPAPMAYYESQGLELKGTGRYRKALCPFHGEKTPSFQINTETGDFHCFGCGAHGGDVLDYHQERYGLGFVDAARDLGAWAGNGSRMPSPEELERMRQEREARAAQQREQDHKKQAAAKARAAELWKACAPTESHPYTERKGVKAYGLRSYRGPMELNEMRCNGALVVPVRDTSGEIYSLEFIAADGEKRYLPDGAKSGHYHGIGKPDGCIYVVEGYATGASVREATGHAVAVAFDAGNLEPVAVELRKKYPELAIVLAADNDSATVCHKHKKHGVKRAISPMDDRYPWCRCNPGVTMALKAAQAVGGQVVFPTFAEDAPGDWNDLAATRGPDEVRRQIATPVSPSEISEPEPLPSLPDVQPLNYAALPPVLRAFVRDISELMQCPPDFAAVACIAMVGAAIGRRVGIRPKRADNWTVIPNQWAMIVGKSGIMKSPAMSAALFPLRKMQAEAFEVHKQAKEDHEVSAKLAKISAEEAEKKARKLVHEGKDIAAATLLQQAAKGLSEPPTARRYLINDSTVEALAETLEENQNGVLVDRDELAGWLRSLDKEGQQEARAFYLTAADGDKGFTTDRIGRGRGRHIPAVCVSIVGGIQPGVLASYVRETQRGGSGDDGLLQRFGLAVYPDIPPTWINVDRAPDLPARRAVGELLTRLCSLEAEHVGAELDEYQPIAYLHFDEPAQALFDEWRAELEMRIRGDDEHPAMVSHLSKYRKLVPGLALINHLTEGGTGPVTEQALAQALTFADYLESHARRIYSYASRPDVDAAKTILSKIRTNKLPRPFKAAHVYRPGWSGLSTPDEAWAAIRLLVDYGYLTEIKGEPTKAGGRPSVEFEPHLSIGGAR